MSADAGRGHERRHDPCRSDRRDWTAEHPLPMDPSQVTLPVELAPRTGSGGSSPYSFDGRGAQAAGLYQALRAHRRRSVRFAARVLPVLMLGLVGAGLVLG